MESRGYKQNASTGRHTDVIPVGFLVGYYHGRQVKLPIERFPELVDRVCVQPGRLPIEQAPWSAEDLIERVVLHPAIEIIGNRHVSSTVKAKVIDDHLDNGGGSVLSLAAYEKWRDLDFKIILQLSVDGGEPAENFLGELRGAPLKALADLLNHLAQRGYSLHVGDYVSTGAATVPQPFQKGSIVNADFGNAGSITLQFG